MKMENFIIKHHEISKKCKKVQKKVARSGARTLTGRSQFLKIYQIRLIQR